MADAATKLYTPSLLALSVELASFPYDPMKPLLGRAKSRTCGSEVLMSAAKSSNGTLDQLGLQVTACAVGQASAALFADHAPGKSHDQIAELTNGMERWLIKDENSAFLPRLELLEPARDYPARHEAILLPWRAALDALA